MAPKKPDAPSHHDLCVMAGRWLRRQGCTVVLLEPQTMRTDEFPDAIGWKFCTVSWLVECKTSRADFFADAKKLHRQTGMGMGQVRYYLAPRGMLQPGEMPAGWGLLEAHGSRVHVAQRAPNVGEWGHLEGGRDDAILAREVPLLIAQLERLQQGRPLHLCPAQGEQPERPVQLLSEEQEPGAGASS